MILFKQIEEPKNGHQNCHYNFQNKGVTPAHVSRFVNIFLVFHTQTLKWYLDGIILSLLSFTILDKNLIAISRNKPQFLSISRKNPQSDFLGEYHCGLLQVIAEKCGF